MELLRKVFGFKLKESVNLGLSMVLLLIYFVIDLAHSLKESDWMFTVVLVLLIVSNSYDYWTIWRKRVNVKSPSE